MALGHFGAAGQGAFERLLPALAGHVALEVDGTVAAAAQMAEELATVLAAGKRLAAHLETQVGSGVGAALLLAALCLALVHLARLPLAALLLAAPRGSTDHLALRRPAHAPLRLQHRALRARACIIISMIYVSS